MIERKLNNLNLWKPLITRSIKLSALEISDKDLSSIYYTIFELQMWQEKEGGNGAKRWKAISDSYVHALVLGGKPLDPNGNYRKIRARWYWVFKLSKISYRHKLWVIAVLNIHRLVKNELSYDISSVVNPRSYNMSNMLRLFYEVWRIGLPIKRKFKIGSYWKKENISLDITSAGPLGKPSYTTIESQFSSLLMSSSRIPILLWAFNYFSWPSASKASYYWWKYIIELVFLTKARVCRALQKEISWFDFLKHIRKESNIDNPPISRLVLLRDRSAKTRVIAIGDAFTQSLLKPLHDHMYKILRVRLSKCDGTFDQDKQRERIRAYTSRKVYTASLDLSSATDRLPVVFQAFCLWQGGILTLFESVLWVSVMAGRLWLLDLRQYTGDPLWSPFLSERIAVKLNRQMRDAGQPRNFWADTRIKFAIGKDGKRKALPPSYGVSGLIKYGVGQPMGLYSSWSSLALTHHIVVWLAARRAGYRRPTQFDRYALLGDDICIAHPLVARHYSNIITELGVKIAPHKSVIGFGKAEFSKSFFDSGNNLSPFSWTVMQFRRPHYFADVLIYLAMIRQNGLDITLNHLLENLPYTAFKITRQVLIAVTCPSNDVGIRCDLWKMYYPDLCTETVSLWIDFIAFCKSFSSLRNEDLYKDDFHNYEQLYSVSPSIYNPYRSRLMARLESIENSVDTLCLEKSDFVWAIGVDFITWTSRGTSTDFVWKEFNPVLDIKEDTLVKRDKKAKLKALRALQKASSKITLGKILGISPDEKHLAYDLLYFGKSGLVDAPDEPDGNRQQVP